VLLYATLASVVNAGDDQRLDLAAFDQLIGSLVGAPLGAAKSSLGVEQILAVLQVEHRIAALRLIVIARRNVHDDGSFIRQKTGVKILVLAQVGRQRNRRATHRKSK